MINIEFDTPNLDSLIQRAVQRHIAGALTAVTCPQHGTRLEAVHIAGDAPNRLQLQLEGCCDELLAAANRALGTSDDDSPASESSPEGVTATVASVVGSHRSEPSEATPLRAFLCHASEDKEIARRIAGDFHASGIDTFFDEWEIRSGDSLRGKIDEGLEKCTHFVVLLTDTSIQKPWVNAEIDAGFVKKVHGHATFIPLRHNLSVNRLSPLLRALLSPALDDYEKDIKAVIDDVRGMTRKPPVAPVRMNEPAWGRNLALTPLAARIAEMLAQRSANGRRSDPQLDIVTLREGTGAADIDLVDAVDELSDLGWVEVRRGLGGPFRVITPTMRLFEGIDQHVMGWDPADDAVRVAAEIVNSEHGGLQTQALAARLGWATRRVNPALGFLVSRDLVLASENIDREYVTPYISQTSRTRRFVRDNS